MTTPLLTIFTTCKPFLGKFGTLQRNALRSWARLRPECEVVVIGDEAGVKDCCDELGFRQIAEVPRSESGTPLLDGLVAAAERAARSELLALVNADIMLTRDLIPAVEAVRSRFERFLMIARRWNVDLDHEWTFAPDWEAELGRYARERGSLEAPYGGVDLFVFPRGMWRHLPPFAIGRNRWDSGLIYQARASGVPVIDATDRVTCVHPNHDYSHHPGSTAGVYKGPEAVRNETLLGGAEFIFSALNATHVLKASGIRQRIDWQPAYLVRKAATLPALYPALRPLVPAVAHLAPVWRKARVWRSRWLEKRRIARDLSTGRLPYPITVKAAPLYPAAVPSGGGVECFDTPEALELNRARLDHLRSLELPLRGKRVVDVGCGVGHLAQFFVEQGCDVLCVDGRKENIERLRELYPGLKARVFDLEKDSLEDLGRFDVVFAYGVLYHLEEPFRALRGLASICDDLLLLETMIADHPLPLVRMTEETSTYSQALQNVGSRPTPSFIVLALRSAGFRHVYAPRIPPAHRDFRFSWISDLSDSRDGHPLRCTFVASRRALSNPSVLSLLLDS
jgi:SAM-dependent methyltransferase